MIRASLIILLLPTSLAIPKDLRLVASLGFIDLASDFKDDQLVIPIAGGRQENAEGLGTGCYGLVADRPDVSINYSSGDFKLNFAVLSEIDTKLVINTPSGQWVCNDDYNLVNPRISFDDPQSGQYDIWIGVCSSNDELDMSQLLMSEADIDDLFGFYETFSRDNDENVVSGGSGTGFLINSDGHVLTNLHVIEDCLEITFQIRGIAAKSVSIILYYPSADLALLKLDSFDGDPAKFSPLTGILMGTELSVYGFPLAKDLSAQGNFTNGIVSSTNGFNDDMTQFQMTAPVQPGNSGGPVLNRNSNELDVVVATANRNFFRQQRGTDTQNVNFAIHGEITKRFLEDTKYTLCNSRE